MYSYRAPRESTYNAVKQFPRALLSHGPRGVKERKYLPARASPSAYISVSNGANIPRTTI